MKSIRRKKQKGYDSKQEKKTTTRQNVKNQNIATGKNETCWNHHSVELLGEKCTCLALQNTEQWSH